jgi:hypothetical protein
MKWFLMDGRRCKPLSRVVLSYVYASQLQAWSHWHSNCTHENYTYVDIFIYLWFIHQRFLTSSDYIASKDRMINEWWIGKDVEGSDRGLIWGNIPAVAWRDWGKPRETSGSRPPGRDLKPGPLEYEAGVWRVQLVHISRTKFIIIFVIIALELG